MTPNLLGKRGKDAQTAVKDTPARGRGVTIADVIIDSPLWGAVAEVEATLHRAIAEASAAVSTSGGELAIVLTDDSAIRALNREWRGIDTPTNVLSFPAQTRDSLAPDDGWKEAKPPRMLGDIVIAHETTAREAIEQDKPLAHHLAHLAVHGFLHLVGYDHAVDSAADAMEAMEVKILARLGIPDPYRARDAAEI
jgi:probable rRNA maturation factor